MTGKRDNPAPKRVSQQWAKVRQERDTPVSQQWNDVPEQAEKPVSQQWNEVRPDADDVVDAPEHADK